MWEIARILPNLKLPLREHDERRKQREKRLLSLNTDDVRICRADDPGLEPYLTRFPAGRKLLDGFRDSHADPIVPAVLAVASESHLPRRTDAIASFRNVVAVSYVTYGRGAWVANDGERSGLSWSDAFDFHAAEVDQLGRLVINSPVLVNVFGPDQPFLGMASAFLDRDVVVEAMDFTLHEGLARAWRDAYLRRRSMKRIRPILRSLEIAYHAATVPLRNAASIHDFGTTVAQWISALECLLHPGGGAQIDKRGVLTYLGSVSFDRGQLGHRRYRVRFGKREVLRVTALQKACAISYDVRNRFLHGEPVVRRHLVPFRRCERATTFNLAALVYRFALVAKLAELYPPKPLTLANVSDDFVLTALADSVMEKAVCRAFGLSAGLAA